MNNASIFRPRRIPSLSRLPKEIGREERFCDNCARETRHIIYLVPRRVAFFLYRRDHPENVHATCTECARSIILRGEDRDKALGRS